MSELTPRQQQVYAFLSGYIASNGYPPTLQEVAAHLGVSGNLGVLRHLQALERHGLIQRQPGSSRGIRLVAEPPAAALLLPVVGEVRAGAPQLAVEAIEEHFSVDPALVKSADSFLLRVKGDSMIEAHILEGDLAVVRPQASAVNGDIVVALVDGEATLKRFFREAGRIRLQPENAAMAPLFIDPRQTEVVILGKVTGLCRPLG